MSHQYCQTWKQLKLFHLQPKHCISVYQCYQFEKLKINSAQEVQKYKPTGQYKGYDASAYPATDK